MDASLYYCYSCRARLHADEVETALARGESHSSACCRKCAQAGKRIQDPTAFENDVLDATRLEAQLSGEERPEPVTAPPLEPVTVAPRRSLTPARGVRTAARAPAPPAAATVPAGKSSRRGGIAAEPEPPPQRRSGPPLAAIGGVAAAVCLFGAFFFASASPVPAPAPGVSNASPGSSGPQPGGNSPSSVAPAATAEPVTPGKSLLSGLPPGPGVRVEKGADDPLSCELAESYLRYKNYVRAREQLDALDKQVPKEDPKYAALRAKVETLRGECQAGSQAALDELLKNAEAKAKAGDVNGVRMALGPQRLMDLLPDHAERGAKELDRYREAADAAVKTANEKRQADAAAMRAHFEKNLPAGDALPPAQGAVIYGPEGPNAKIAWKEGKDALRSPAGKLCYLDGAKKVTFEGNAVLGMVTNSPLVIEYSASEDCEIIVSFSLDQFGWRGGIFKCPAGTLRKIEVNPNDDNVLKRGRRGKATGRQLNVVCLEPKSVKPGTLAVFRISR